VWNIRWIHIFRCFEPPDNPPIASIFLVFASEMLEGDCRILPNEDGFSTNRIYERYQATTEKADAKTLSEHRVYELLKEQAFLGVVESTRTGGGRGEGSYLEHRLVQDTGIVLKSVLRDSRLEDLA